MYDTILVPTDGSDHSIRAAEHALFLAEAFDSTVHLVHVVDLSAAAGPFSAGGIDEEYRERLERDGREAVDAVTDAVGDGDRIRSEVITGVPAEAILDYADDHDVEMIAMGTHGRTGVDRYVAGSVAERVVRTADVPVLTVGADQSLPDDGYDEVLVPADGGDPATAAVDPALAIATVSDARVHAVNVVDVGDLSSPGVIPAELLSHLEDEGRRATDAVADRAREAGLDATTAVREGYPAEDILEYADENDIDLIAMGTAGRTGLSRHLLGSTTERIVRHAGVPVLAVRSLAREGDQNEK